MTVKLSGFQELLDKANTLLKYGSFRRPTSKFVAYEYLTNNETKDVVEHWYDSDIIYEYLSVPDLLTDMTVVIHGHEKGKPCAAPFMCHEFGYQPDATQFPEFHRVFYQKWPQYGKQVSRSNRSSVSSSPISVKFKL